MNINGRFSKKLMDKIGLSVSQYANILGVEQASVYRWHRENSDIKGTAKDLIKFLEIARKEDEEKLKKLLENGMIFMGIMRELWRSYG